MIRYLTLVICHTDKKYLNSNKRTLQIKMSIFLHSHPVKYFIPAEDSFQEWCHCLNQVEHLIQLVFYCHSPTSKSCHLSFLLLVCAADPEASLDREMSLELIRYLVPDVFKGALLDTLSGHALSAAGLAASFTVEGNRCDQLTVRPTAICSVIKAQQPGWSKFLIYWNHVAPYLIFLHHLWLSSFPLCDLICVSGESKPFKLICHI